MATVAAMRREIRRLREQIGKPDDPRKWMLYLIDGELIPECIRAQIGGKDEVVIRYWPIGFCEEEGDVSIGHVATLDGQVTVLHRSGAQKEVPRESTYRSRYRASRR